MILIGRGLDLIASVDVLSGQLPVRFSRCDRFKNRKHRISGDYSLRVPPVPIPNTEVKPQHADGTWLETARESRSSPDSIQRSGIPVILLRFALVAQWQSIRLLTEGL